MDGVHFESIYHLKSRDTLRYPIVNPISFDTEKVTRSFSYLISLKRPSRYYSHEIFITL